MDNDLSLPYDAPLDSGVYDRLTITVQGVVSPDAELFSINLYKNEDIAFHFNPRFSEDAGVMVRNSLIDNTWGPEERDCPYFPFTQGQSFQLQILCSANDFNVKVNNEQMFTYNYRVQELSEINRLNICGGITLQSVHLDTLP